MIILGQTNDDKGTQLERLTSRILTHLGYTNVINNLVGSGGEEIDVSAQYQFPGMGGVTRRKLLCECKAYKTTIGMSEWLKFLGKIYLEEAKLGEEVFGCFIALSGVNGNVAGNYDDLFQNRTNINLVTGERILSIASDIYGLCSMEKITEVIGKFTPKIIKHLEVGYYNNQVFWVTIFGDDTYTVLDESGNFLSGDITILCDMLQKTLPVKIFIDLKTEIEAQERAILGKKIILWSLILDDNRETNFEKTIDIATKLEESFEEPELKEAAHELNIKGWVSLNDSSIKLISEDHESFYTTIAEIYRFILTGKILLDVLGGDFYDKHINEELFSHIQETQKGLPMSQEEKTKAIELLRLSPTALLRSLQPDPMIITHHEQGIRNEQMDIHDKNHFFRMLFNSLKRDFNSGFFTSYFHETRDLRELEIKQAIVVKNDKEAILQENIIERIGIGELADELGGGYIRLLVLDEAPQPWEWNKSDHDES
ncbi:restriction endonuclease [Robertmurraya sp.]|uniref:restriction endonuclease n=1 Tax=Robertmurraya sp. TaxID=2837525 RepID=UPI003703A105